MEKIYLDRKNSPMLGKGIEAEYNKGKLFIPLCHIQNFIEIYENMLKEDSYGDTDKKKIEIELKDLKEEYKKRNNPSLCGEWTDSTLPE